MRALRRTKQQLNTRKVFGFDIETADDGKKFVCATISSQHGNYFFRDKQKCIDFFKRGIFRHSYIAATNLSYDFFGTFLDNKEMENFNILLRGSSLISAKTRICEGKFEYTKQRTGRNSVIFIDTLNYALMSVEDLGKILNIEKIDFPLKDINGNDDYRFPKNEQEWEELRIYNERDAEISRKAIEFFIEAFEELGATFKLTIASTAMSLFKNHFLDKIYYQCETETLKEIFESYYGGRTEAFERGYFKDIKCYDINSMYPGIMAKNKFPDPNSVRVNTLNKYYYIKNFEGCSRIKINIPNMYRGCLPHRTEDKLLFPTGTIEGWWTNVEIRNAVEKFGCVVLKIYKNIYFKKTCSPFKGYVDSLYPLKTKYKLESDKKVIIIKLLLNSLYGKFGQKFLNKELLINMKHLSIEDLSKYDNLEPFGIFAKVKIKEGKPSDFCIPIWASYITAYGRIQILDLFNKYNAIYGDTDSFMTREDLESSEELGEASLEKTMDELWVIRPKMYGHVFNNKFQGVIKGCLNVPETRKEWVDFLNNPKSQSFKIVKFKESVRRNLQVNEVISIEKEFNLEDKKRVWKDKFDSNNSQISSPINILNVNNIYKELLYLHHNDTNYVQKTIISSEEDESEV